MHPPSSNTQGSSKCPTTTAKRIEKWWHFVDGLSLLRTSQNIQDNDPILLLYNSAAKDFFKEYEKHIKGYISYFCESCGYTIFKPDELDDVYFQFYEYATGVEHLTKDRTGPRILRIKKALLSKQNGVTSFRSFVRGWAKYAAIEWMRKRHYFRKTKEPTIMVSLDDQSANNSSILKTTHDPGAPIDDKDLMSIAYNIIEATNHFPINGASRGKCKVGELVIKEFIRKPKASQRDTMVKYQLSQQQVSYYRRQWIGRIESQLKKQLIGPVSIIDHSITNYKTLVMYVYEIIGERPAWSKLIPQKYRLQTR